MLTLSKPHTYEEIIKKSRFIATAVPIATAQEAQDRLENLRQPEATHNCWAYQVDHEYRFSDDGEPGGTAGRPILSAIQGQGVNGVLVVVTRYFGGIKLGAGGLVRAYGGAASECLRAAPKKELKPLLHVKVTVPFDAVGALYTLMERLGARKDSETYTQDGVTLSLTVEKGQRESLVSGVADATRGQGEVEVVAEETASF